MTPDQLRELFPRLRDESFADASNGRLLSWARIYISLYNLVAFNSLDAVYGDRKIYRRKIDTLFRMLQNRCGSERDAVLRARMIQAMFSLVCGIVAPVDSKRRNACCEAVTALVRDRVHTGGGSLLEQVCLCKCLTDLLYPGPVQDDLCYPHLQRQIAEWISGLTADGGWQGVSVDVALERIGVLNRNSYMFLDKRYDGTIRNLFDYYRNRVSVPEESANFDACSLPVLGCLYDVAVQGNAYMIDCELTHRIALLLQHYGDSLPDRTDVWYFCTAYAIDAICEQITGQIQSEVLQHTA